ncbi:MAG TPA: hypothetical protein VL595_26850 [Pseudonocardia sp.]|jgi:hypothetical protein|nr:hypothetical protein [Pseudonocardia sp.]
MTTSEAARPAESVRAVTHHRGELLCVWCGPALVVLLGAGLLLAGLWPPPRPTASPAEIAAFYTGHLLRTRIGLCLMMAGIALLIPWGASIAVQTNRTRSGSPIYTYVQVAAVAVSAMIGVLSIVIWGTAAFRADELAPETTRTLNDLGWLFFVFDWSPLFVWYASVSLAIFGDRDDPPLFPRWSAYVGVWVALLSVPGGVVLLFKTGPLAFNGIIGIWIPLGVFFVWILVMTTLVISRITQRGAMPETTVG